MKIKTRHGGQQDMKTYLVTEDLFNLVSRWCYGKGVKEPEVVLERRFFDDLLERLTRALKSCCFADKNIEVVGLDTEAFDDLLKKRDHPNEPEFKEFWVSLDDVYAQPTGTCESKYNISITRYVAGNLSDKGRGPRPEIEKPSLDGQVLSLDDQVLKCVLEYRGVLDKRGLDRNRFPLVLVDDGTFKGKTITTILKKFADQHESFRAVRLGVARSEGIKEISEWSETDTEDGRIHRVPFIGASKLCPPLIDWVCERDFFPGVLYGGRVVVSRTNLKPLRVSGLPVRAQYLYLWGEPGWASIESGKTDFTIMALRLSIELWDYLETVLKRRILVEDLSAIPLKLYGDCKKNKNKLLKSSWVSLLKTGCQDLIETHDDPEEPYP